MRHLRAATVMLLLIGCRVDFEEHPLVDGGTDADAGADADGGTDVDGGTDTGSPPRDAEPADSRADGATDSGTRPDPLDPFGDPTVVAALSAPGTAEDDPTLTGDMLEIYFSSLRPGGAGGDDVWTASRPTLTAPWSAPVEVAVINTAGDEITPEVSADGLSLYFTRRFDGDIHRCIRASRAEPWPAPSRVDELSTRDFEASPAVDNSDTLLVFDSRRPGGTPGVSNLWMSTRAAPGSPWGVPEFMPEVSSPAHDTEPFLSFGGLHLFLTSARAGTLGSSDMYVATHDSLADPFGAPLPVTSINTTSREDDAWLSPDGRTLFFSSDRDGSPDIFVAQR